MSTRVPTTLVSAGALRASAAIFPSLMLGGEIHNSSSSSPAYMDAHVWDRLLALNCDTVLAPVTWQQLEPAEGRFDFTVTDALVDGARRRGLRLVPLWFGAYKNTWSSYAPDWVKRNLARFPRAEITPGRPSGQLSVFSEEVLRADAAAFAAMMHRIHELDADRATVPLVQVENEVGILCPTARDRSPTADTAWMEPVPPQLLAHLTARGYRLRRPIRELWEAHGAQRSGTWAQVFGESTHAAEVFMAWHYARFVGTVAEAGRGEHDVPMFVNAWVVQWPGELPGSYPSGGPVAHVIDIWQAAAPGLPLAADVYVDDFATVTSEYTTANAEYGLPLLLPEVRADVAMAAKAFWAAANVGTALYAPFGIDSVSLPADIGGVSAAGINADAPANPVADIGPYAAATPLAACLLAEAYAALRGLGGRLQKARAAGMAAAVVQAPDHPDRQDLDIGGWRLRATFRGPPMTAEPPAAGIVVLRPDRTDPSLIEIEAAGYGFDLAFIRPGQGEPGPHVEWLEVWEGTYAAGGRGSWRPGRCLNGDELGIRLPANMVSCRRARAQALKYSS